MQIRIAEKEDYIKVKEFYYSLTDAMQEAEFRPGWEKNIYPSQDFLKESIENDELFLCEIENAVAACMIINHKCNEGYQKIRWSAAVSDSQLYVIHALGVHPDFSGRGIAKEMARRAIREAQIHEIRTIRLDVLEGNLPAEKVYTALGFHYLDTIRMYYEDTGWTNFKLFEYLLSPEITA
ncbi:MAG TPA: GNAT family N-acetyltransferase [Candidatus Fusicatenibacter merdavium]|uniref:GNAT family N-acetyltransferase n=1 Tax=Candidatus Fusicatenibacter merdavium TaxID=2838600 RepID=A0A9D1XBL8_9FIRM|nr:GNAT family N-acetyltransferase [Candidatus Fusicatenibacter merdavium]